MSIPTHDEIRVPALKLLKEKGVLKLKDFEVPLAEEFNLTHDELIKMYDSGNGPVFYDRISWALSYLNMAGLTKKPKRAYYEITEDGMKVLNTPEKVDEYITKRIQQRNQEKSIVINENITTSNSIDDSNEDMIVA